MSLSFLTGMLALLVSLGASGWTRSRAIGLDDERHRRDRRHADCCCWCSPDASKITLTIKCFASGQGEIRWRRR
jgi:hypothetical protein